MVTATSATVYISTARTDAVRLAMSEVMAEAPPTFAFLNLSHLTQRLPISSSKQAPVAAAERFEAAAVAELIAFIDSVARIFRLTFVAWPARERFSVATSGMESLLQVSAKIL